MVDHLGKHQSGKCEKCTQFSIADRLTTFNITLSFVNCQYNRFAGATATSNIPRLMSLRLKLLSSNCETISWACAKIVDVHGLLKRLQSALQ